MQFSFPSKASVVIAGVSIAVFCQGATQDAETKPPQAAEAQRIPARATPGDYQAHAQAGTVTLGAEFTGHSIATPEAIFSSEDYVAVEVGMFGSPAKTATLSFENFSLRINGKKPVAAQPFDLVFHSLKDPNWSPPNADGSKPKTSFGSGGGGDLGSTPAPVHMPIGLERTMDLRVQKASLPEGDRALPEAGLIFFQYRGKTNNIRSLELIYNGSGGKATLALQP